MQRHIDPKRELMPTELESLRAQIWEMPYLDRTAILVASIIQHDGEAVICADGLIRLAATLSSGCSTANRLRISETLRSAADALDHEPEYVGLKG